jgi:hypothetical protein
MTRQAVVARNRPLPLVVPTAFVRIRPRGAATCGTPATHTTRRHCAASRRLAR